MTGPGLARSVAALDALRRGPPRLDALAAGRRYGQPHGGARLLRRPRPGCAAPRRGARGAAAGRRPDRGAARRRRRCSPLAAHEDDAAAGRAARLRARRARAARSSTRSPPSRRSGRRSAARSRTTSRCASIDLPAAALARADATADAPDGRRAAAATRSARSPPRPATPTPSAGGRTSSSCAAAPRSRVRRDRGGDGASCASRVARRPAARGRCARRTCGAPSAPREREGRERVAVVCGAWHVPALAAGAEGVRGRRSCLKGLPQGEGRRRPGCRGPRRGSRTRSGYGAGVDAPGWYHHLFAAPDARRRRAGWCGPRACCASEGLDVSSAHVDRGRPAGRGARRAARPARRRPRRGRRRGAGGARAAAPTLPLRAGRATGWSSASGLGEVPREHAGACRSRGTSRAPQRRLRLKRRRRGERLDLDLRRDIDRERSHLLHRLRLLGVHWGVPRRDARRHAGTFREIWRLALAARSSPSTWSRRARGAPRSRPRRPPGRTAARPTRRPRCRRHRRSLEQLLLADLPARPPAVLRALGDARGGRRPTSRT